MLDAVYHERVLDAGGGGRPKVIPEGSRNLALVGQYVEIERDVVFTVEYSVRGADGGGGRG